MFDLFLCQQFHSKNRNNEKNEKFYFDEIKIIPNELAMREKKIVEREKIAFPFEILVKSIHFLTRLKCETQVCLLF